MKGFIKSIARQRFGFVAGLLTSALVLVFWSRIIRFADWSLLRETYNDWGTAIQSRLTHQIEIPVWAIALVLPLAVIAVGNAVQHLVNRSATRIAESIRAGQ